MIDLEKLRDSANREVGIELSSSTMIELLDHIAALEKDAGRYQKLVQSGKFVPATLSTSCIWGLRTSGTHATKQELDAAVDAIDTAMESKHG